MSNEFNELQRKNITYNELSVGDLICYQSRHYEIIEYYLVCELTYPYVKCLTAFAAGYKFNEGKNQGTEHAIFSANHAAIIFFDLMHIKFQRQQSNKNVM